MGFTFRGATALGTTILFLVPGAAFAQSAYDWTGPYVGVTLGAVISDGKATADSAPILPPDEIGPSGAAPISLLPDEFIFSTKGALAGLTAGYNQQMGNFVVGIEADGSFVTLDGENSNFTMFASADERLNSLLTLRGRLGVTNGPVLAYATLGVAGGQASYVVDPGKSNTESAEGSGLVTGIVGGAGVEVAVNENISVKTEGLMYRMSSLSGSGDTDVIDPVKGGFDSEYTPSGLVVRTGINLHF